MDIIFQNKRVWMIISICFCCAFILFYSKSYLKACHLSSQAQASSSAKYVNSYRHIIIFSSLHVSYQKLLQRVQVLCIQIPVLGVLVIAVGILYQFLLTS